MLDIIILQTFFGNCGVTVGDGMWFGNNRVSSYLAILAYAHWLSGRWVLLMACGEHHFIT